MAFPCVKKPLLDSSDARELCALAASHLVPLASVELVSALLFLLMECRFQTVCPRNAQEMLELPLSADPCGAAQVAQFK